MSAETVLKIGARVRTPRGLLATVVGTYAGRVRVRYDAPPEEDLAGLRGSRLRAACEVDLPEGLLAPAGEETLPGAPARSERLARWTPAEDAVIRAEYSWSAAAAIGERLGRSVNAVRVRAGHLGVLSRRNRSPRR